MAKEKRTVFYGIEEGGNQAPLVGFSKLKVKNTAGSVIENNGAWNSEAGIKTAEIQFCYFVTVEANTNEEAVKVVDALVSGNVNPISSSEIVGPRLAPNTNSKYGVVASTQLEEITPSP